MNGIRIKGMGMCVPSHIVTNDDLAQIVDTNDEWITTRTGIKTRHHIGADETLHDITVKAAKDALKNAGVTADQIGACIVATMTPDTIMPSAACRLQEELGLPNDIPCFDLSAACTGFLFALHTMECLLNASSRKYGLVIGAEHLSRVTNWSDRSTCILFGDGAAGAVVECREGWRSICADLGCYGDNQVLKLPGIGMKEAGQISMDGQQVFKFAVQVVPHCIDQVLSRTGYTVDEIDFFVFHQANARIIDLAAKKYNIPPEKCCKNIAEYGNTSAASIPLVLAQLYEEGKLKSKCRALLVGFGGGLTWGGALVEFV